MSEQAAATAGCGERWPLAAPALPAFCLSPCPLARASRQNWSGSHPWPWQVLRDATEEPFTKPGKPFFFFFFFCTGHLDVQRPPTRIWPPLVHCGCLRLGCAGGRAGQHLAPQRGNLLPRAGWGGEAAGTQPTHAGVQRAEGWLWDKHTAQEGEPQGLGRISKRWEDGGWEQERAEGLAGAGSHQAAHATVQGLARHRLAPAPASWSSGSPLVPSLL